MRRVSSAAGYCWKTCPSLDDVHTPIECKTGGKLSPFFIKKEAAKTPRSQPGNYTSTGTKCQSLFRGISRNFCTISPTIYRKTVYARIILVMIFLTEFEAFFDIECGHESMGKMVKLRGSVVRNCQIIRLPKQVPALLLTYKMLTRI